MLAEMRCGSRCQQPRDDMPAFCGGALFFPVATNASLHGGADLDEALRLVVRRRLEQEVDSRQASLLPVRRKDDHRLLRAVRLDRLEAPPILAAEIR